MWSILQKCEYKFVQIMIPRSSLKPIRGVKCHIQIKRTIFNIFKKKIIQSYYIYRINIRGVNSSLFIPWFTCERWDFNGVEFTQRKIWEQILICNWQEKLNLTCGGIHKFCRFKFDPRNPVNIEKKIKSNTKTTKSKFQLS